MPAVSQALVEFANHHRMPPAPGVEVIVTPRYQVTLQPDFPIPGPNNVSWIRCRPDESDEVIREARATISPRHLPVMWTLDPETEPPDFADHLTAHGIHPDPHGSEFEVMVLPIDATIEAPEVSGLEIRDALADPSTFRSANAAAAEAFGQVPSPLQEPGARRAPLQTRGSGRGAWENDDPGYIAMLERRRLNSLAAGNRHWLLAVVDGEPAGAGGLALFPPGGATVNGGAVRPKFRGRGVYRALVAARLEIARRAGVAGLAVWGGDMSRPILAGLGFETVGWRRFYLDTTTA